MGRSRQTGKDPKANAGSDVLEGKENKERKEGKKEEGKGKPQGRTVWAGDETDHDPWAPIPDLWSLTPDITKTTTCT